MKIEINWPIFVIGNLIMDSSIAVLAILSIKESYYLEAIHRIPRYTDIFDSFSAGIKILLNTNNTLY